jgi:pyruvate/2-oxoglutarate dehydrogenase complex dihydrolipoamide acyltransferase (E2) component
MYEFRLPDIGEGLAEAELLEWFVKTGDEVTEGQDLAVISTDKVNVELPSPTAGKIIELCCEPGQVMPVGTVLVRIEDGKDAATPGSSTAAGETAKIASPTAVGTHKREAGAAPVKAAPVTRRLAAELGVDLEQIAGSGPQGQILNRDLESAAGKPDTPAPSSRMTLSGARLAASRRIAESSRTLATSTLSFEVPADAILAACSEADKVGPLAVTTRCVVRGLQAHPHFNARIDEKNNELLMYDDVHLGLAVDTDDGLMVPVIRSVQSLNVADLSRTITELATRARTGKLTVDEMSGSTFTLSSTGGLERVTMIATTPVINLPNVATLWVSRITDRPRVMDGQLQSGPMMSCSLAFDHRYLHGADGMAFINDLGDLFRNP